MQNKDILFPVCAMVLLTVIMQFALLRARGGAIRRAKVRLQEIAGADKFDQVMVGTENISDHFENLFEVPVLFYVAAVAILALQLTDPFYVIAAWAFVILRYVQSYIHCTNNRIKHRFYAYFLSSMLVWVIWARIAYQLLNS
ncbi:MAG: MAPEG family protein [Bdellovibrionia bacterium]